MANDNVQSKRCPRCESVKPMHEFASNRYCKPCNAELQRIRRATEQGKQYTAERNRLWQQSPQAKEYYARPSVRARRAARFRSYRKRNPDKAAARHAIRQAKKSGKIPPASTLPCAKCGKQANGYHHHQGYAPENHLNVIPLCKPCHVAADQE